MYLPDSSDPSDQARISIASYLARGQLTNYCIIGLENTSLRVCAGGACWWYSSHVGVDGILLHCDEVKGGCRWSPRVLIAGGKLKTGQQYDVGWLEAVIK